MQICVCTWVRRSRRAILVYAESHMGSIYNRILTGRATNNPHNRAVECSICRQHLDDSDKAKLVWCTHEFHAACINQWVRANDGIASTTCPMCRTPIRAKWEWVHVTNRDNDKCVVIEELGRATYYLNRHSRVAFTAVVSLVHVEDLYTSIREHLGRGRYQFTLEAHLDESDQASCACAIHASSERRPVVIDALRTLMLFPDTTSSRAAGCVWAGLYSRPTTHATVVIDLMRKVDTHAIDWIWNKMH